MNPRFYELIQKLGELETREAVKAAIAELEERYGSLNEHDQEVADRLIADLFRRLEDMD